VSTDNNPEAVAARLRSALDVFGSVPGSILYRGVDRWQVLLPGSDGEVLGLVGSYPAWVTAPSTGLLWEDDFFEVASPPGVTTLATRYSFFGAGNLIPSVGPNGGLQLTSGGTFLQNFTLWVPNQLGAARGLDQFCEVQIGNRSSALRTGLVLGAWSTGQNFSTSGNLGANRHYFFFPGQAGVVLPQVQRVIDGAIVNVGAAFGAISAGDVVLVTLTWNTSGNVIEVFYNGVSQGTRTDTAGAVAAAGIPGFGGRGNVNGSLLEVRHLRCGALSEL